MARTKDAMVLYGAAEPASRMAVPSLDHLDEWPLEHTRDRIRRPNHGPNHVVGDRRIVRSVLCSHSQWTGSA